MGLLGDLVAWFADPLNWQGPNGIPTRMLEHVLVCGAALAVALAVALPIGLYVGHTRRFEILAVGLANVGRAVPSFAVIMIVLTITARMNPQYGFDLIPTFVAMTLLAIPPILVNTYVGVRDVDLDIVEAARGMGMAGWNVLGSVEVPLAMPVIIGGTRTATVQVIATATLGAIIAFGGLGRYVVDGIARREYDEMYAGVVLVALLALGVDALLAGLQRRLTPRGVHQQVITGASWVDRAGA